MRVGQVTSAMRVRAGVAPRVASGDPAASKGKSAGGASFGKRRVGREERCAATHAARPRYHCSWKKLRGQQLLCLLPYSVGDLQLAVQLY
jgi:hypothetical protein